MNSVNVCTKKPALIWLFLGVDTSYMGFQFFLRNKTFWTFSTGKLLFLHVSLKSVPGQVLHLSRALSYISDMIFKETCAGQYGHWRRSTWNLLLCNFSLCFPLKCFSHRSHLTGSSKSKQSFVWLFRSPALL